MATEWTSEEIEQKQAEDTRRYALPSGIVVTETPAYSREGMWYGRSIEVAAPRSPSVMAELADFYGEDYIYGYGTSIVDQFSVDFTG